MGRRSKSEDQDLLFGFEPKEPTDASHGLALVPQAGGELGVVQVQFNKLLKRLEKCRKTLQERVKLLDQQVQVCVKEVLPIQCQLNKVNYQMILLVLEAFSSVRLTARRREALEDLLGGHASKLLNEPDGLSEEELQRLDEVLDQLMGPESEEDLADEQESSATTFDGIKRMMEDLARQSGVELDLSDLDLRDDMDPAEIEGILRERVDAAIGELLQNGGKGEARARKPTKAQLAREEKMRSTEEAKQRDLKSLYKQLAKTLHPDLEQEPGVKQKKEEWMKRLTSAYANEDLRDMLSIEMEWLGVEASNLQTATDEKLKVYCAVLKDQITTVQQQIYNVAYEPQYQILHRFQSRLFGLPNVAMAEVRLRGELAQHQAMLKVLKEGGDPMRKMLHRWADDHAPVMNVRVY